ncbi:hypothetical protein SAMN04515649_10685 [Eubacterium callanderi]|uniref:Uncharacterized protein n=2 Tax=Eubacterium callanderi TaxID=53442 RepID=A0AB74EZ05_9FIRM|nr:hypothetical protein ELI_2123 [Eubacterium callanderi]MDY7112221.1 hypothetical protein [Eubacterium callanderi]OEZ02808.1 hypothetical protein BUME_35190 [[Butyribacterium] methylotrophicum]WPK83412.1 hypothetical protein EUCAMar_09450 [Eubacterium callanderi]SHL58063.1 hypothetical protein SAMN04515649_10685 [Eubacterium callanderi]
MHKINANFAVGLNCPVSMELMVLRETPTSSARADWDSFFSFRISFKRFFRINSSFKTLYPSTDSTKLASDARDATPPAMVVTR